MRNYHICREKRLEYLKARLNEGPGSADVVSLPEYSSYGVLSEQPESVLELIEEVELLYAYIDKVEDAQERAESTLVDVVGVVGKIAEHLTDKGATPLSKVKNATEELRQSGIDY